MNEMELLRELAQETPLPAPAELNAARARLVAEITTDPATYATAVAEVPASSPGPPASPSAGPVRPAAPAPVLAAARFMYGGAVSSAALLIVALPFVGDLKGTVLGQRLTPTPLSITLVILAGLALIGLWLWMARSASQGSNWARILSTVLFGLATLEFLSAIEVIGKNGVAQAFFAGLTWLSGLGAVWLLWRPASSAFFKSAKASRVDLHARGDGPS
jgi:hypothetical protein